MRCQRCDWSRVTEGGSLLSDDSTVPPSCWTLSASSSPILRSARSRISVAWRAASSEPSRRAAPNRRETTGARLLRAGAGCAAGAAGTAGPRRRRGGGTNPRRHRRAWCPSCRPGPTGRSRPRQAAPPGRRCEPARTIATMSATAAPSQGVSGRRRRGRVPVLTGASQRAGLLRLVEARVTRHLDLPRGPWTSGRAARGDVRRARGCSRRPPRRGAR